MNKRFFSLLAAFALCLTLIPTTAFADDEKRGEDVSPCSCETACTVDNMNKECPVCGAENAIPQNCGQYIPVEDRTGENGSTERADDPNGPIELGAADQVQAMIDGLPNAEEITEENAEEVKAQLEAIDEAKEKLSDEEIDELDMTRYAEAAAALGALAAPMLLANDLPDEQFSLTPGGRYYFDLSAMNIPGTANGGNSDGAVSLPDTSLHYVPFTYVGTIEAYKLTSATATTEEYAQQNKYPHSLFVADYAVTHTISWGGLNDEGLIFGKNYASGGVDYTLRAPSVGSISTGSGDSQRGVPQSNEWDTMLNKNSGYIQNWNKMYSWGQDAASGAESFRAYRGYNSARFWYYTSSSFQNVYLGFRPVLEVLNADTLGFGGLKAVTLDLNGGKLGGSSEDIQIIVKNGSEFTAPASGGLTRPDGNTGSYFMWLGSDGKLYAPGASVPADVTNLTAQFALSEQFTLTPGGRYYFDLSAMGIPGTVNTGNEDGAVSLPDTSLHYVPFTYAGTIEAYKLTSAIETTEKYAQREKYPHSLFIADYNVTFNVDWNQLNEKQMIFGTPYTSYGVNYTMRAPSAGSQSNNGTDDSSTRGIPKSNEWDAILDKANQDWKDNTSGYIKNWSGKYSFGQDNYANASYRAYRGYFSARFWGWSLASTRHPDLGFRPVLELPTGLAADSLKVVEVRLGGTKIPGETGNWINIIVKKGERFTAPSADGLPRPNDVSPDTPMWWTDGNGNYYKPGSTVPADVSMIYPLWGGFGLLLDRGDGAVEVTPDNYTDIFGDGSASFVLPKGETFDDLINYYQLNEAARHKIYSTGKYGENIFPNLKLKNAELTSVTLNRRYIEQVSPFFITLDGKNTIGSLSGVRGRSMTLSILGGGTLALNSISDFGIYAQNDVSVTIADALNVGRLYMFSGSLTVTDDTQAVTLGDTFDGYYPLNVRVFAGNSAQDAVEVTGWQLSPEMLALYQRFYAGETLTNDENSTLKKAIKDQWDVIRTKLSGKPYARFTQAWDVTYQPGTNGKGDGVTDVKFYGDALTLRDKLFTRSGYTQVGWATADGGEKIYDLSGVYTTDAALTLYPVWTRSSSGGSSGSSSPSYAVTVPDKTEHGTVTANRRYAEKGDTVTITVTPDSGYVLETITATDKNGNDLKLTDKGNGKYTFTMPGSKVEVKATFMEDNSVLNFFYDVPNDAYYYEAVKWAAEKGVTSGIGNSLFAPNQPCTRAQIVTFLWRAAGSPVVNYLMPFTDVDEGVYYAEAVRWAASTGIVTGLTETTFGANGVCTRAQVVTMLYRFAKVQGMDTTQGGMAIREFDDFDSVPAYALEAMDWAVNTGVFKGDNNRLLPQNACTRAQIVTLLRRAFGK